MFQTHLLYFADKYSETEAFKDSSPRLSFFLHAPIPHLEAVTQIMTEELGIFRDKTMEKFVKTGPNGEDEPFIRTYRFYVK